MSDAGVNSIGSKSVTVVIPTLGGASLSETIERLNIGTHVPAEILVCIPEVEAFRVKNLSIQNVKLIKTPFYGQVAQRSEGFKKAKGEYVLQLDDDMLLDKHCVENLLYIMAGSKEKVAVAPSMLCVSTGESPYKKPSNKWLLNFYYWLLNGKSGYQPGTITRAGTNIGIDLTTSEEKFVEVDWVAGGCIMHRKENLILKNFYPFRGKAYSEDLYHSYYLKQKGVKLLISSPAHCFLDCTHIISGMSTLDFVQYLRRDIKSRIFLVKLSSRSLPRMSIYYFIHILRYMATRLKLILKSG